LQIIAITYLAEGDHRMAESTLAEALPIWDRQGNRVQQAWHHALLGWAMLLQGALGRAEAEMRAAITQARRLGGPTLEVWSCFLLCAVLVECGRPEVMAEEAESMRAARHDWGALGEVLIPTFTARARLRSDPAAVWAPLESAAAALIAAGDRLDGSHLMEKAAVACVEADRAEDAARVAALAEAAAPTDWFRTRARLVHGVAARMLGDVEAVELVHDALADLADREILLDVPLALETLGGLSLSGGSATEGARLLACAESLRQRTGQRRLPGQQARFEADVRSASELLAEHFIAVWEEASGLSVGEAVGYARRSRGERKRPTSGWDSLTPTERQVVELAAQGLTNPDIGRQLFMSRGTVKTHLAHVYAKLNLTTRAELASVASRRNSDIPPQS
jgi:DNA-binding CsgD family transcriptional regulator